MYSINDNVIKKDLLSKISYSSISFSKYVNKYDMQ